MTSHVPGLHNFRSGSIHVAVLSPPPSADVTIKEVGLEGALFTLLDRESDPGLRRDLQETLVHMMASSATNGKLGHWLKLCKDVLSATSGGSS